MKEVKIVGIAPYNGLKISMENVAQAFPEIDFIGYIGNLEKGIDIARKLNVDDIDVIVSRGGTALMLKKAVNIPIVEINITIYDIIRSFRLAQALKEKTAIVGFDNITERAELLNDLLDFNIDIITIDAEDTAENVLKNLKKNGYEAIISDQVTFSIAQNIGLNAILINSVEETIMKSIEEAINIGKTRIKMKNYISILKKINEKNPMQVLIFDEEKQLMKEHSIHNLPKKIIDKVINVNFTNTGSEIPTFKESYKGKIYTIKNDTIKLENQIFKVFYIMVNHIIAPASKAVELKNLNDNNYDSNLPFNSSLSVGTNKTHIMNYAKSDEAVFLIGEKGTGKDKMAQFITQNSGKNRLWEINCKLITKTEWNELLNSPDSPLQDESTAIHFKNMRSMTKMNLNKFINYSNDSLLFKRNKIILSTTLEPGESTQELVSLFNDWPIIFYTTTSLRERKSDIPAIASLYINQFNNELGKQVIGFEPQALERLVQFHWPSNQTQFKRVLKQLIIKTNGSYIKDTDTLQQLKEELGDIKSFSSNILQLDQTLAEINKDIINIVLSEENGNKTKTSKRLGISRSTLWRVLNNN